MFNSKEREEKRIERSGNILREGVRYRNSKHYLLKRTIADITIGGLTVKLIFTIGKIIAML